MKKKRTFTFIAATFLGLISIAPKLLSETFVLKPIADAFVQKAKPTTNTGSSTVLWNSYYKRDKRHSYLLFELPENITKVTDAKFTASLESRGGSPYINILLLGITDDNDWDISNISEKQLTWSNAPHKEPYSDIAKNILEPGVMFIAGGVPHYASSGWNPLTTQSKAETSNLVNFVNKAIKSGKRHVTIMLYAHPRVNKSGSVNYKSRESDKTPTLYLSTDTKFTKKRKEQSKLQNGSFENGLEHWRERWPKGRLGNIEPDGSIGRNGRQCAKIVINNQKGSRLSLSQSIEINPKNVYELSFSFYTPSTNAVNATVRLGAIDQNGQHIGYFCKKQLASTANVWVDYKLLFAPPANTRGVTVEFNFMGPLECWLDDVKFDGVDLATQAKMKALDNNPNPVFQELLIPGSAPIEPRVFPYWGYNNDVGHFRSVALRYGWQFSAAEQYEECAKFNLAPFSAQWKNRKLINDFSMPTTNYLVIAARQRCWKEALENGAQVSYPGRPNPNAPIFVQTCLDNADKGLFTEQPPPVFYFFYDEMFNQNRKVVKKEDRKSEYWRTADAVVRKKYGFGKIGIPDSNKDSDPLKWIAYMRWQADLSVDTFRRIGAKLKAISPATLFLGPDEFASFCPQDWERMGREIDIQPGQVLAAASGYRRFNPGYMVKFYHDLTGKPVYPFIQTVKYGASPSIKTIYDWTNQVLRSGGEGLFVGAVEWYDREINHSKYAAPRKWAAILDIVKTLQKMEKVRLPADKSMALHFGSYTQMSREHPPQEVIGSAFAILGPRSKAWFTFTDDFQIDRNIKRWDDFKVVVIADAKYVSRDMMKAVTRFVKNGGTIVVTDPEAFSFALDGENLTDFRKKLFGVSTTTPTTNNTIIVDGKQLQNPSIGKTLNFNITDGRRVKTIAQFIDGSSAIIEHQLGKGRVWRFGFNPFRDAAVDDMAWIDQWRKWLTALNVPLDHKIWRFELPMVKLPPERKDICWTGNAIRYRRNFPDVTMNAELSGNYSYAKPPEDIPERTTDKKIGFKKGLLTNRRNLLKLKRKANGSVIDIKQNAIQNWAVRFGADETARNSITIDLSRACKLTQLRLVFSGTLPATIITVSNDGINWKQIGALEESTAGEDVLVAEEKISGSYRYIRLNLAERSQDTTLTLAEMEVWGNE